MSEYLKSLLSKASSSAVLIGPILSKDFFRNNTERGQELVTLLKAKNGFFAFTRALQVFPTYSCDNQVSLVEWNASHCWRSDYDELDQDTFFLHKMCSVANFVSKMRRFINSILKLEILTIWQKIYQGGRLKFFPTQII